MAVRETSVSRHNGSPIEDPLKSSDHHNNIVLRGLRGPYLDIHYAERIVSQTTDLRFLFEI